MLPIDNVIIDHLKGYRFIEEVTVSSSLIALGLDSIHLSELEFRLQNSYPQANLPHGFTLQLRTIEEIVNYVRPRCPESLQKNDKSHLECIPLSSVQRRILFLCRLHPEDRSMFNETISFSLPSIDLTRFRRSIFSIIMRHAILRTVYGEERQFALSATECYLTVELGRNDYDVIAINIETDPPIRVHIGHDIDFTVSIDLHHIAVDGRSIGIIVDELKEYYSGSTLSKAPCVQYIDVQRQEYNEESLEYWKNTLNGMERNLLPSDHRRSAESSTFKGSSIETDVPPQLMENLNIIRKLTSSTTFSVLLSIYRLFMYKTTGLVGFPIGIMVDNRDQHSKNVVGCFVNTCVLRTPLDPSSSFIDFAHGIQKSLVELRRHSTDPFDDVVDAIGSDEDNASPIFNILFVNDNISVPNSSTGMKMNNPTSTKAKYEQTWYIVNEDGKLSIKVEYQTALFKESTIIKNIEFIFCLIQTLLDNSSLAINSLTLMRSIDWKECNDRRSRNRMDYPDMTRLLQNIPVCGLNCFGNEMQQRKKMMKLVGRIVRVLQSEYIMHYGEPNRPDDFVSLYVQRSINLVPLVIAAIKAGFAVVPISIDWPRERRIHVLSEMRNLVYISDVDDSALTTCLNLNLDYLLESTTNLPRITMRNRRLPTDIMYATFTSGTTGTPKCICTNGTGMANILMNYSREYAIGAHSRVYQVINYAFDIFFVDILIALVNESELVMASTAIPKRDEMEERSVTHCFVMPAFLNFTEDFDLWSKLDTVLVTGETMQRKSFEALLRNGVPLHQLYGATEQTINTTTKRLSIDSNLRSVGRPYHNLHVFSVDPDGLPIPHFWQAILRYGGLGLSRGIFGREEQSSVMFPQDETLSKEEHLLFSDYRCFHSGDFLKKEGERSLVFLGRNDRMRKIRGRIIDLSEIEYHLTKMEEVKGSLLLIDNYVLIGYVVASNITATILKDRLKKVVPDYMVPDHIILLERFPTNANGKVDMKALPAPYKDEKVNEVIKVPTDLEQKICTIFKGFLKKEIRITDCFFSSGGNSLLAMLAVQKIESTLSLTLPLKQFFALRTAERIAEYLQPKEPRSKKYQPNELEPKEQRPKENQSKEPQPKEHQPKEHQPKEHHSNPNKFYPTGIISQNIASPIARKSFVFPLSHQQQRIYLQQLMDPSDSSYQIPMKITFDHSINLPRLRSMVNSLIMANDALRTDIVMNGSKPTQVALSATESFLSLNNCTGSSQENVTIKNKLLASVKQIKDKLILTINIHHISIDGRSLAILAEQVHRWFTNRTANSGKYLEYCSTQLPSSSSSLQFWKDYLDGYQELRIPTTPQSGTGHSTLKFIFNLDVEKVTQERKCSIFHVLVAAYVTMLRSISGQQDITIGTIHGNRSIEDMNTVGLFINLLPLRFNRPGNDPIDEVMTSIGHAFAHQSTPFNDVVQALNPSRLPGKSPIFQHVINFQNTSLDEFGDIDGVKVDIDFETATETAFDQCWKFGSAKDKQFVLNVDFNSSLFAEDQILEQYRIFKKSIHELIGISSHDTPNAPIDFIRKHSSSTDIVLESWIKHLSVREIKESDNFFQLGGHSLTALSVISDLSELYGEEIPFRSIFEHQTLGDFTAFIEGLTNKSAAQSYSAKSTVQNHSAEYDIDLERISVSSIQKPILYRLLNNRSTDFIRSYNIPSKIRLNSPMSPRKLRRRLNEIVLRHPALRTIFVYLDKNFYQRIGSGTESYLQMGSQRCPDDDVTDCLDGAPITVSLVENVLEVNISHLNADGHSIRVIAEEIIGTRLNERCSYTDWIINIENSRYNADSSKYWYGILKDCIFNPFKTDRPRLLTEDYSLGHCTVASSYAHRAVQQLCSRHNCTPFVVYLASLGVVLRRYVVEPSQPLSIAWPVDLRSGKWENMIGMATNTLLTVIGNQFDRVEDMLKDTAESVLSSLEHRAVAYDDLTSMSKSSRLFDVMLVSDSFTLQDDRGFTVIEEAPTTTKFPLALFIETTDSGVSFKAHFMSSLFDQRTIEQLLNDWESTILSWSNGERLMDKPIRSFGTVIVRMGQFVLLDDLKNIISAYAPCEVTINEGEIVLTYDSSHEQTEIIEYIKKTVPLELRPDIIQRKETMEDLSLPLISQQLQMFYLQSTDNTGYYNVPFVQRFEKNIICIRSLVLALHHVRQNNPALRSVFKMIDGEPRQVITSATESYYYLAPTLMSNGEVLEMIGVKESRVLEIEQYPAIIRACETDKEIVLFLVISHVICDGWSTGILQRELSRAYLTIKSGKTLLSTNKNISRQVLTRNPDIDVEYVKSIIDRLPISNPSSSSTQSSSTFNMDDSLTRSLQNYCSQNKITPFTVFSMTVAKTHQHIYSKTKINIGTVALNRTKEDMDEIGCFMNTVVIPLDGTSSIEQMYQRINRSLALNVPNFELLKEVRKRLRDPNIRLFDVFINCRYDMESEENVSIEGTISSEVHDLPAIYPTEISIDKSRETYLITIKMIGNKDLMKYVEVFRSNLAKIVGSEKAQSRIWRKPKVKADIPSIDLISLLYEIVKCHENVTAIITPIQQMTYGDLLARITELSRLIKEQCLLSNGEPLRADDIIAVVGRHSLDSVILCLAVLASGCAYLPLLGSWPKARIEFAVGQASCRLVLNSDDVDRNFNGTSMENTTKGRIRRRIESSDDVYSNFNGTSHGKTTTGRTWRRCNLPSDIAYVIYTSGTTGQPKGVVAIHSAVVNMLTATTRGLAMRKDDVVYQFTKFVFDNSVLEIWLALSSGAALFLDNEEFTHHRFTRHIHQFNLTHALIFPGLVESFTDKQLESMKKLRMWCMGAEKASQKLVDKAIDKGIRIIQVYGPTETTTYALSRFMRRGDHANNLGDPLPNTEMTVELNNNGSGELLIRGAGLMRGYIGKRKVECFREGFYSSGDIVRPQKDTDTVIFVGRNDNQVKVRGYRVELAEVENALLSFASQVKVLFDIDAQQIIAFVKGVSMEECRDRCRSLLPEYMIPSRFVIIDRFPLTDNAKVDVEALRAILKNGNNNLESDQSTVTVSNEERLLSILKSLGFIHISLDDNFLQSGGNSILAMRLVSAIEDTFVLTIDIFDLYKMTSLREILLKIDRNTVDNVDEKLIDATDKIRSIWIGLIKDSSISNDDHFFLVGGDSFMLLRLLNRINNTFNIDLTISDFLANLTINKQAIMIANQKRSYDTSIYELSFPANCKGTIILLHPLIGGVQMPYRNIIKHLSSSYRIIGFQHPNTFDKRKVSRFDTIETMISTYLRDFDRSILHNSNNIFVGASLGALLAFEMASQLGGYHKIIVIDGTSNTIESKSTSYRDHEVAMRRIIDQYEVDDHSLIDNMISNSWDLYQLSVKYKPRKNNNITCHVFSLNGTDLGWGSISSLASVNELIGEHNDILNKNNSLKIIQFLSTIIPDV